jgi:hypothetical protein
MIISKAEGRSLKEVDIDLREECFSRLQLYAACSKVGSAKGLHNPCWRSHKIQQMLFIKKFCVEFSS